MSSGSNITTDRAIDVSEPLNKQRIVDIFLTSLFLELVFSLYTKYILIYNYNKLTWTATPIILKIICIWVALMVPACSLSNPSKPFLRASSCWGWSPVRSWRKRDDRKVEKKVSQHTTRTEKKLYYVNVIIVKCPWGNCFREKSAQLPQTYMAVVGSSFYYTSTIVAYFGQHKQEMAP